MTTILLTGGTGQLGWELKRTLASLGQVLAPGRDGLDLADPGSVRSAVRAAKPDLIVNAAGYTTVDRAESEPALAARLNAEAPGVLAEEAKRLGAPLVHFSTDYVYDGRLDRPYTEEDAPNPVNEYGRSKLAGEQAVAAVGGAHLILRTSWVYSARRSNFVLSILRLARERPELRVVDDQTGSPTWARALAEATAAILRGASRIRETGGVYHLAAEGYATRYELACEIVRIARARSGDAHGWAAIRPVASADYERLPAARPPRPVTAKDKIRRVFGVSMAPWREQLRAFLDTLPLGDA